MSIKIIYADSKHSKIWDNYVYHHPKSTLYHLFSWKTVIEHTYGHTTYYLAASGSDSDNSILGILPLIHLKHLVFGNSLISIPFFDMGGILAENEDVEQALLLEALTLARTLNADSIELRHIHPVSCLEAHDAFDSVPFEAKTHKVRMLLRLPDSSEELMTSLKSKLRSQINKPLKEGLQSRIGGTELLNDFYQVFLVNMRDLGSPVHSKALLKNMLAHFTRDTRIVIVYNEDKPCAGSIISGFKDTLENPWASSLRQYSRLSPNMLLYWAMLEYACDHGYRYFDFGRSTPDEGTYKFKKQWGAKPQPLQWYSFYLKTRPAGEDLSEKSKFDMAIHCWQRLPVSVTAMIGPMIRKHIGL